MWALIYAFVIAMVVPVLKVALRALGIGGVVFIGFNYLLNTVKNHIITLVGELPDAVIMILDIAGFFEIISLLFSALAVRILLMGVNKTTDEGSWWTFNGPGTGGVFRA